MEDLLWRKKSRQRGRYLMLFLIRLAETLTVSLLPSVVGLIAVFITPKPRVMQTIELVSLLVFAVANCFFWTRYVFHRAKLREFYIMNGIVYFLYVLISFLAYMTSDPYLYSVLFSNMRGLEILGCRTFESLYKSHLLLVGLMFIIGIVAKGICVYRIKKSEGEGVEKVEMEEETVTPEKENKVVEFLTVDEVNLELEREIQEAAEMIRLENQSVSDKNWDSEMVQGNDGEIIEATPVDPENDIDDSDYVSEAYALKEMSVTQNYDVGALWNPEIYQGREVNTDYDEEEPDSETFAEDDDSDGLWGSDMYRGRGESIDFEEEPAPEMFAEDDDSDGLWGSDMYRGRGESIDFEEEPAPETFAEDDDSDGLWDSDMYRGRDENNGLEYEEDEQLLIDWDEDETEVLFHIEYDDEPEEYFATTMEEYDIESLWSEFTQGQ